VNQLLHRVYVERADADPGIPHDGLPQLAKQARPAQDFVKVDVCLPGCPPQNKVIAGLLTNLLEGRKPEVNQKIKFG
jgi:coenzyme F420-reducing hydrogenase gamma subunit